MTGHRGRRSASRLWANCGNRRSTAIVKRSNLICHRKTYGPSALELFFAVASSMSIIESQPLIQPETEPPRAVIRRWKLIVVAVAFGFPIVELIIVTMIQLYPRSSFADFIRGNSFPRTLIQPFDAFDLPSLALGLTLLTVLYNWPFFVLAARVKRTFVKYWPNDTAAKAAIIGGLIGLSMPYVLWWGVFVPPLTVPLVHEFVQDRGQGAIGVVIFWPISGLLAWAGLRVPNLARNFRKLWQGRQPLALSFWLYFVLGTVLQQVFAILVTLPFHQLSPNGFIIIVWPIQQ
jgi:hypothetical protein